MKNSTIGVIFASAAMLFAGTAHAWITNIGAGAHGSWTGPGAFYIGSNTSENAVNLFEGGTFRTTEQTFLGYAAGANSNAVAIDGAGSVWTNTAWHFRIGESGDYNSMAITDGGRFHGNAGSALYLGWNAD